MYAPEIETMPRERLQELQGARLAKLVHYVYERVPHYRAAFDEAGVVPGSVRSIADVSRLPITYKHHLHDNYPLGMFAVERQDLARIHASSGTTGKPTIVGYTRNDLELFAEVNARCLAAAGAKPGMLFHNAYGYGLFTGGLGLHGGAEKLGLCVVPVSGGMTERQATLILDLQPDIIACTPSYGQTLAEEFDRRGIAPDGLNLRFGILGAEPWTEAIRSDVEAGLGIEATNIYGLSEIIGPGVANEGVGERDGSYIWEDHFYPEILDPQTAEPVPDGREGVLVITTLTKEALPLIRFWTGDITTLTREPGASGRTHARIGMILGRADDMLIIRGVNVYPTQIESVLQDVPQASAHYQLIVTREKTLDAIQLRLELTQEAFTRFGREVLEDGMLAADQRVRELCEQVSHRIRETVGIGVEVRLLAPGSAPRSGGGKLRRVVDERRL
ncbi:MAG TPA: phenylacetate--CoA ligase [Trueperaceae bacterium]|nr:phenylacetate--CoA ligase [Trueperaceae bacterium]